MLSFSLSKNQQEVGDDLSNYVLNLPLEVTTLPNLVAITLEIGAVNLSNYCVTSHCCCDQRVIWL